MNNAFDITIVSSVISIQVMLSFSLDISTLCHFYGAVFCGA